ncbi:MAG: fatty acid desaturase [Verrucomicrobiales bacterium]|jgi:fatty acid desaturase
MSAAEQTIEYQPVKPWISHLAFPMVTLTFYSVQALLALSVYKGWIWLMIPLVLVASHLMHGLLIGFHEATHGSLRKGRLMNEIDGVLLGIGSYISFTLYRVTHQTHHMHLAGEKDVELWPFVDPTKPRWARRLAAFIELNFGMVFTPFLFWRVFFKRDSPIRNKRVRRKIWIEGAATVLFWAVTYYIVARFNLWQFFLWNYFIPGFIAANLQSWRKYIEHVGLNGNTSKSATRSIVANTWLGRVFSVTLLHEPLHGVHHIKRNIPHGDLPEHVDKLLPEANDEIPPFPHYRAALVHLFSRLWDPQVGGQWTRELGEKTEAP